MSQLIIQLAPRPRPGGAPAEPLVRHLLLAGGTGAAAGVQSATAGQLPGARQVIAVVGPADLAWHRVTLPRANAARMKLALQGLLEEQLLGDEGAAHVALPPRHGGGQNCWVAVTDRAWLSAQLSELQRAGCHVDRVVPLWEPAPGPHGHFELGAAGDEDLRLVWSDKDGVVCLGTHGGLARALATRAEDTRWSATPAAAKAAERWLGRPVDMLDEAELLARAAASSWDLRQFDLAASRPGWRALGETLRQLATPAWRPVRWGLVALVVVHLAGLNAWAMVQQRSIEGKRQAMAALLRDSHPQVRAVLDAPRQMSAENRRLRALAGRATDADFEPLLAAAAAAWPQGAAPPSALRFESRKLTLVLGGWDAARVEGLRARLRADGWQAESGAGQLTLSAPDGGDA